MAGYGIDITTLDKLLSTPSTTVVVGQENFALERYGIDAGATCQIAFREGREATLFLESGVCVANGVMLEKGETIALGSATKISVQAKAASTLFVFWGSPDGVGYGLKQITTDFRDKYWGTIETIVNKEYTGKRIFCRKGQHASLEYHCDKREAYFVESGKLLVRLRAGRGEDRFFEMPAGTSIFIPRGLMHQRGGLEDTVILEISSHDSDSDSFLVEDGQKLPMPGLAERSK